MKSIIEKYYYGEVNPCEKSTPNSKNYKETSAQLANIEEEMLNKYPDITT